MLGFSFTSFTVRVALNKSVRQTNNLLLVTSTLEDGDLILNTSSIQKKVNRLHKLVGFRNPIEAANAADTKRCYIFMGYCVA